MLPQAVCLAGPTGCGKTALACELAAVFGCEIINADSRQTYADFPLITAQPGQAELAQAKHHLYGFLPTTQKLDAASWSRLVLEKISQIANRGHAPLLIGGTGFYFQALLRGLSEIPAVNPDISASLREQMEMRGPEPLYQRLAKYDPVFAGHIHPRDRQRILRGLEILESTGQPLSWWHANHPPKPLCQGPLFCVDTTVKDLEPRLDARIGTMIESGALEEVRAAYQKCPDGPGWSGIGCREVLAHILGKTSFSEMRKNWLASTRAYAKRQITWFRSRGEAIFIKSSQPICAALRCLAEKTG